MELVELIKEVINLLKQTRDYCALDGIEELFEDYSLDDIISLKEFREVNQYAITSTIAKEYIEVLESNEYDFTQIKDYGNLLNLYIANKGNDLAIYHQLVALGVNIFEVDEKGNNILHLLALEKKVGLDKTLKQVDLAKTIITGDNIEELLVTNYNGLMALELVVNHIVDDRLERNLELIYYLFSLVKEQHISLDEDVILNLIIDASNSANVELFKFFLDFFGEPRMKNNEGQTLAHSLVVNNLKHNSRFLNTILEKKIEMLDLLSLLDEVDDKGQTPLLYGLAQCKINSIDFWSKLIEKGVNLHAQDNEGNSALLLAVHNIEAVKFLVRERSNLNVQNKAGITPLIQAVLSNKLEVVKILVESGANIELVDNLGRSALSVAVESGNEKISNALMGI